MKRIKIITILLISFCIGATAQNASQARAVLDKTAKVLNRKGGLSINFTMSGSNVEKTSGSIAIKGKKYKVQTPQATVWYNGKTQWTYMKNTEEVNITTPSQAQQQMMNPYAFINLYRTGYNLSMKTQGKNNVVHMVGKDKNIQEMYITINKTTLIPSVVKIKQNGTWTSIAISGFTAKNQPDNLFVFKQSDYPNAEIVDLR